MKVLGILPARGGSKGILRKNLRPLGGVPLVLHIHGTARTAGVLDRLVVSTEDQQIARTCREAGAEVIDRPADLAEDDTPTLPVIQHAVRTLAKAGYHPDAVLTLQATQPFTSADSMRRIVDALAASDADSATTVRPIPWLFHPYNARQVNGDGTLSFVFPDRKATAPNRQAAPEYYAFGNLILTRTSTLLEKNSLFGARSVPVLVEHRETQDIDDELDWEAAELMLRGRESLR